MKKLTFCYSIFLVFLLLKPFKGQAQHSICTHPDFPALKALYQATNGGNWTNNTNWDTTGLISCDPCKDNWYGIRCIGDRVWDINLFSNNLEGTLPIQLGTMDSLRVLQLQTNRLIGNIPEELGNLSKLRNLRLHNNALTGKIPTTLGNLPELINLYLQSNALEENIPSTLGQLKKLTLLFLDSNQLVGEIPRELGNMSSLERLSIINNALTGEIPTELGNLSNLRNLNLFNNQLTGEIPSSIGNLNDLEVLDLGRNKLAGSIPTALGNLNSIIRLRLSDNQLTGEIPSAIGDLITLEVINFNRNDLSGCFPENLKNLCYLTNSVVSDFCNPTPSCQYNFSENPLLPWEGDFSKFCNGEQQERHCDSTVASTCSATIEIQPMSCDRANVFLLITEGIAPFTITLPSTTDTSGPQMTINEHEYASLNLSPGTYQTTIKDATQCAITKSFTVADTCNPFDFTVQVTDETCNSLGSIWVDIANGQPKYEIHLQGEDTNFEVQINPSVFQLNSLVAGNYTLSITDAEGESESKSIVVRMDCGGLTGSSSENRIPIPKIQIKYLDNLSNLSVGTTIPNPFITSTTLPFKLSKSSPISLEVFSNTGQLVYEFHQRFEAGQHEILLNENIFGQSGLYVYRIKTAEENVLGKVIKLTAKY